MAGRFSFSVPERRNAGDPWFRIGTLDVGTTVLFHHDPYHTDDELEELLVDARRQCDTVGDDVCLAHEGMTIALDRDGVRISSDS